MISLSGAAVGSTGHRDAWLCVSRPQGKSPVQWIPTKLHRHQLQLLSQEKDITHTYFGILHSWFQSKFSWFRFFSFKLLLLLQKCNCKYRTADCVCPCVTLFGYVFIFNFCFLPTERWSVSEFGSGLCSWDGLQSGQTLQPSQTDSAHGLCQGIKCLCVHKIVFKHF